MTVRLPALLLATTLLAFPTVRAQNPTTPQDKDSVPDVTLRNDTVLVNVVVTQGQNYAGGLTAADFAVTEDGAPQRIDNFFTEQTPFAAAILLDTSGSMEYKLRLARVAAARFMDRAKPEDRVAVYLFGSEVRRLQDFTAGGRELDDSLWDTSAKGITKMYDCVGEAADALAKRQEFRRAILLLSDGADSGSGATYDGALRRALAAGVTIYTIDLDPIGGTATLDDQMEIQARGILKGFAEKSGGKFFSSKGGTDLNDAFSQIVDEIGHQYTIAYSPTNQKHDGSWRKIGVTCARRGVKLRARDGYHAPVE
jgi:VWFA-related protein